MNPQTMTPHQIYEQGIKALANELGPVGLIRFLQQYEVGKGNYSVDRDQWLTAPDVETLANQIQQARKGNRPND